MLAFTQVNLHKAEQAAALLSRGLENKDKSVALITEPRTVNGHVTGLPRGTRLTYSRPTRPVSYTHLTLPTTPYV